MKVSRDTWLLLLLLVILVTIMVLAGMGSQPKLPPLTSTSAAPDGAKALKLWMPELGHPVDENLVSEFAPPQGVGLVMMLQPEQILESEWEPLDAWVEAGGTLIVAGDQGGMSVAATHYKFSTLFLLDPIAEVSQTSPLLASPVLTNPVKVQTDMVLTSDRNDYVVYLATKDGPIAVSFAQGKGRVILCTSPQVFTNLGLKEDANAAFVLNLIALAKPKSTVWFDEWHHGLRAATTGIIGPDQWLRHTPIGNAFIFILVVVVVGLFLQGRAFGRPVPLPHEIRRRGVLEHVTAVANLGRRAGHRSDVLRQYHQQLKRHLGRRYRLDPSLADADYVAALTRYNPTLDHKALLKLLNQLRQPNINETDLVRLAAEAAQWIKE
jgi:hypothetical protein